LYDWYAHLQCLLVFNARRTGHSTCGLRSRRRRRGSSAHEVRSVNLYLVTPLCPHLTEGHLRVLQQQTVLHVAKADRDTGRVSDRVRTDLKNIGWKGPGSCSQDELERVFGVKL
jgi:hypothetical protein